MSGRTRQPEARGNTLTVEVERFGDGRHDNCPVGDPGCDNSVARLDAHKYPVAKSLPSANPHRCAVRRPLLIPRARTTSPPHLRADDSTSACAIAAFATSPGAGSWSPSRPRSWLGLPDAVRIAAAG